MVDNHTHSPAVKTFMVMALTSQMKPLSGKVIAVNEQAARVKFAESQKVQDHEIFFSKPI